MKHRTHALIHALALCLILLMAQALTAVPLEPATREASSRVSRAERAVNVAEDVGPLKGPDSPPQIIILKLDDVVAHSTSVAAPVSPRWQRVTDFLKDGNIKGSFGDIGYSLEQDNEAFLKSKGCVFMTPSEYVRTMN